jgi:hypothetical protein
MLKKMTGNIGSSIEYTPQQKEWGGKGSFKHTIKLY